MSYILDALQRADAERERGQVPGLHSRAAPFVADSRPRWGMRVWWPALALVLAGLALLAWWLWWPSRPLSAVQLVPAATAPAPVSPAPPAPAEAAAAQVDSAPALPILAPALSSASPAVPAKQPPRSTAETPAADRPAPQPDVTAGSVSPAPVATAPAPQEARLPSFGELSAEVRARLPQVSVSGATYSANPAHRMLIVNGQVLQEGQEIQSGLRLVSIGPRSATLDHQGLKYTIGY